LFICKPEDPEKRHRQNGRFHPCSRQWRSRESGIQTLNKTLQEKELQIDAPQSNLDRMVADSIDQRQRIERMEPRFANLNSLVHSGGAIKPALP